MFSNEKIALPKKRSFARWLKLAWAPYTLWRALEYEAIEGLYLEGRVLDIGGGHSRDYPRLLKVKGRIETINIAKSVNPTYLADIEMPLPFKDGCFDHMISLNTLEHIENDELALSEALRVLKKGGTFHFMVPFLYRVHASPSDYHRHTASWWSKHIDMIGVSEYKIEPLAWDARSSVYSILGMKRFIRSLLMLLALIDIGDWARRLKDLFPFLRDKPWRPGAARVTASEREVIVYRCAASYALGYYISGKK